MAESDRSAVSAVAIIGIVILVALAIYFVMREADDDIEIDLGSDLGAAVPALVIDGAPASPAPAHAIPSRG